MFLVKQLECRKKYGDLKWLTGLAGGVLLMRIPVLGMCIFFFSALMWIYSLSSDKNRAARLYCRGLKYLKQNRLEEAYALFSKALSLDDGNFQIMEILIETNLLLKKDIVEARMLIEELELKWSNTIDRSRIQALRDELSLI